MAKALYSKPFFTTKARLGIDVTDDPAKDPEKVYFKISDLRPQNVVWTQDEKRRHESRVAAEVNEVLNIAHGLKLFREQGYEKFCEFAKWITPKSNANGFKGNLTFFHKNADTSVGSGWGLSIKENPNINERKSVPYVINFSINQNGGEVGKVGRSFPISPLDHSKFEDLCKRAAKTAHDNELEVQVANRKANFNKHQNGKSNGQSSRSRSAAPPPCM